MDKESRFELQKIDCNCNDCIFMVRDFERYKEWESFHKNIQLKDFEAKKKSGEIRTNSQFQFDKNDLMNYGKCSRFKKDVSFIPNTCQIETQNCFLHRRESNI
jgi:hypothetical protein